MKNMIADLERGLNEQENYIRKLEWLANQNNEFTYALVNSFVSSSLMHVPRTDFEADSLYFDNRTYQQKTSIELPSAVVSERGKKLILDVTQDPVIRPVGVLFHSDENSYETEINVDIDNPSTNMIDGKRGTFWFRNVYLSNKVEKVTTVIEFDLGRGVDINYFIVEGGTQEPFFVEGIEGIAPGNHRIDLDSTIREVDGKTRIDFSRTFVRSVKITFAIYTYHKMNYWTSKDTDTHGITNSDNRFNRLKRNDSLAYVSRNALASENLANLINIPSPTSNQINSFRYTLALDNVWFGNDLYKDSGIFVSKPLKITDIGTLSIRTEEGTETGITRNSIEYEIIKIDRSPKYKETRFSIPKINQSTVVSERLIFTKRVDHSTLKDVAVLRFCPYIPNDYTGAVGQTVPVDVYLNGELLAPGTDWEYAFAKSQIVNEDFDWKVYLTDGSDFSLYTLNPVKVLIKIKNPTTNGVYTVNYTIRTSDYNIDIAGDNEQDTVWLDANKTVYLNKGGHVIFKKEDPDVTIESDVYLQITLRRNKASQSSTPELYEYAVLAADYN
jgi:hypothetical protein